MGANSDFDVRNNFQAAVTYNIGGAYDNKALSAVLTHWNVDARELVRSALPVNVLGSFSVNPATEQAQYFYPNVVQGQPLYLYGPNYPGGKVVNFSAFQAAASGVEGNSPRNIARGFDAVQGDLALHRDFPIYGESRLQFRAEAFNLFNHAIFGTVYNQLSYGVARFGHSYRTLNNSLSGLNPLYQVGGPRSLQLALKLMF
jgi:hypothetical protein